MIFTMTSKEYMKYFLANEEIKDILFSQYVVVSNFIRAVNSELYENVITPGDLFPESSIVISTTDQLDQLYPHQLEKSKQKVVLSAIVKTSLDGWNIVIMTTPKEDESLHILKHISNAITKLFDYPVYSYKDFYDGKVKVYANKDRDAKVRKKVEKIYDKSQLDAHDENVATTKGKERFYNSVERGEISKEFMAKILKREGLYKPGMTKSEMKEMITTFT